MEIVHECMCKATRKEDDSVRVSLNWITARRGTLRLLSDSMECGDWRIPYSEIEEAVLFSLPWLWFNSYVLRVKSKGQTYQFGLNPGRFWKKQLPFPVQREKTRGCYWQVVNIIRFAVLAYVIYWIVESIVKRS